MWIWEFTCNVNGKGTEISIIYNAVPRIVAIGRHRLYPEHAEMSEFLFSS
jgi:hypothetical protein